VNLNVIGKTAYNQKFQSTAGSAVFFRGHFLSKFSVFAEFILYLPAATEFGVIEELELRSSSSITPR